MTETTEKPFIKDDAFFRDIYPSVKRELRDFVSAARRLRVDPGNAEELAALATAAGRLLADAYTTCKAPLPKPPETVESFVSSASQFRHVLQTVPAKAALEAERELTVHLRYYKDLEQTNEGGASPDAQRDLLLNVISIISYSLFDRYRWQSDDPRRATSFYDSASVERDASDYARSVIAASKEKLTGWCSQDKAMMLYRMVRDHKPRQVVEIGIYGGRSLIPIAVGLKENRGGEVLGIETWSASVSVQIQTNIKNDLAWSLADYNSIKRSFLSFVLEYDLTDVVRVVEAPSNRAHLLLDQIDFIHIDGGHSAFGAAQDVVNFVPKVTSGGLIVFDDIDWETTGPAVELLMNNCRLLHVVPTLEKPTVPGCAVFQKL